ncbi:carbamoyltransferase family protein [Phytohabitans suffuscus]|uniref:Nodulation protein NolNO n=1 Tax=Phytohabitans suffuscus TaxID=624315 RepID=A0A6F8YC70_9ACTN|nr:carbamoyltransferase N-terminal domain-containing protein [Phytohabitans suffuscus]BCB83715.1 nodulation protein NolNO [Phytohabitans suffuscus]
MDILGISGAFGHDPAAALVRDGVIVGACEEERFTRQKRAMRQPAMHSVQACLDMGGIDLSDVDRVVIGWDPDLAPHDRRLQDSLAQFLASQRLVRVAPPPIHRVPHHRAHAALGYFTSGFQDAAILVVDGQGEDVATTIFHGRGRKIEECVRFGIADSLGFFYAAVTRYLGFAAGGGGKTMGLAASGRPTYDFPEFVLFDGGYRIEMTGADKPERMKNWMRQFANVFGPPAASDFHMDVSTGLLRSPGELPQHLRDAAASAQAVLESALIHLARLALECTGSRNLVLSGGVALNCTANGRIRQMIGDAGLFVNGAAHDGGTALGAALADAAECGEPVPIARSRSMFTGPCFDSGPAVVRARRAGLTVTEGGDMPALVSRRLIQGEVGGWFAGQSEYGPRALGGRSIIARSDRVDVRTRVNAIKGRAPWRPLAPAMTADTAASLGIGGDGLDFMIEARWLSPEHSVGPLAGIVHIDNSVRPLVVDEEWHPFHKLLQAVRRDTGHGVVTNTSFNEEYEPLVNSPMDALRSFIASDLDFLVLEGTLIEKPR